MNNTKRRHPFKELKRMFDADKLPLDYLYNNVKNDEIDTFIDGIHKNIPKHFPDGTLLSKKQLKVLRTDLFIIQCADKRRYHSSSERFRGYCSACSDHRKRNKLMKPFTVTKDMDCECAVCITALETGESVTQLGCQHKFHKDCIQTWLIQSLSCPCCRRNFEPLVND
jgi:hypothetical protein